MASVAQMKFKRYDGVTHTLTMPIAAYVAGSTLRFTAKPSIDNDNSNTAAVINKTFGDSSVTLTTTTAKYTLSFTGSADITNVSFLNGADVNEYEGEFKYIAPGKAPVTYPGDNNYIDVLIYANVQNGIS